MAKPDPKIPELLGLRLGDSELEKRFDQAWRGSGFKNGQDALRIAVQAMVTCYLKTGRIPRDMEVRQAAIGSVEDATELLKRAVSILYTPRPGDGDNVAADPKPAAAATTVAPAAAPAGGGGAAPETGTGMAKRHLLSRPPVGKRPKKAGEKSKT